MSSESDYEAGSDESDSEPKLDADRNYRCKYPECNYVHYKLSHFKRHVSNVHRKKKSFKCTHKGCIKAFISAAHLKRHIEANAHVKEIPYENAKSPGGGYQCTFPGCNAVFLRPSRLERHFNVHENKRPYKCSHEGCDKSYTNSSHLKRHVESHSVVGKSFTCNICSVSMSTLSNLKRHYSRAHNSQRELYCTQCQMGFRKKNHYEEHMEIHANSTEIFSCDKCGKTFPSELKFRRHKKDRHEAQKKEYKCPVENCLQVFEKWNVMLAHRRTEHVVEFKCQKCDQKFINKTRLRVHAKTHIEDRIAMPCPYEKCQRLYYFKRNLATHIRMKHMGSKFHCDICGLTLSTKQKIEEHMIKIHLSEKKPFKRKSPAPRKDIGQAKRSALTELTGIQLSVKAEVELMKRNPAALLRDRLVEDYSSFSEDDGAKCA